MHQGLPEYGVSIKPSKSLVSFHCEINGMIVPRTDGKTFPYCGLDIDIVNLDLRRSAQVKPGTRTSDSFTIEYSNVPGRTFRRKALNALKIQMHGMYFDTSFNSLDTALANLYRLFQDAAQRIEHYIRSMPKHTGPSFRSVKGMFLSFVSSTY
jgi:telomerase reverse transcriptase